MPAPIIPWMPHNIPGEIQSELNRRKTNRSFDFVGNQTANWDSNTGEWNQYKGPMVSWVRMCSNSTGPEKLKKPRFVFHSGKGFYQGHGFSQQTAGGPNNQIIGYTPGDYEEGEFSPTPHVIENNLITPVGGNHPIHVPPPEISKINVVVQKELFRRADVEWVCFSWKQLEYMAPYFLIPGITVMLEWGWNHFNPTSLVPLYNKSKLQEYWKNSYPLYTENILRSKGNYDVIYGIVSNFHWSVEGNKIICSTEITSKDRLYAGISKDTTLTARDTDADQPPEIFQNIKTFLEKDDTVKNIKRIAASDNPVGEIAKIDSPIWNDIFKFLWMAKTPEAKAMKMSYIHGVFSGRTRDDTLLGKPQPNDFDNKSPEGDTTGDKMWINMGLVVELLNYFSSLPGGKDKPMFTVDIFNTVIGGHPNLISCDARVLIPNHKAPKFHYGAVGMKNFGFSNARESNFGNFSTFGKTPEEIAKMGLSDYAKQFAAPISVPKKIGDPANEVLGKTFYQFFLSGGRNCYRSDLNVPINRFRIRNIASPSSYWSFPSATDEFANKPLPDSPNGLKGNYIEKDRSGLLSNVYINYNAFKTIVLSQDGSKFTYTAIYNDILKLLMDATDGYWDLALVEVENIMTITDKRYVGPAPIKKQGDPVYSFDYYDSDSLIKALKFTPKLSDAQATRAMYGSSNNKNSKYSTVDKNDLTDYKFKDAVNYNEKERVFDDSESAMNDKNIRNRDNLKSMLLKIQTINQPNDPALQMTIPNFEGDSDFEVVKLVLPDQELLRLILDDKDEVNNSRYCAVQPGIILEITLLGIGGLRTFQYFLVKNLPEPYSDKNIIFRITDVIQNLEAGNWETTIRAQPIPLKAYIKQRLMGPLKDGTWPPDSK